VGHFTARLSRISDRVLAFDLSEAALTLARKRQLKGGVEFAEADLTDLRSLDLKERTFDLVCCLEVFYYLPREQWEEALLSLSRFVKPGGEFMVSAPIIGGPYPTLQELASLIPADFVTVRTVTTSVRVGLPHFIPFAVGRALHRLFTRTVDIVPLLRDGLRRQVCILARRLPSGPVG
jgi:2-polyprenyl-3-methyl-5-hydroxy-6-metoxy-1,4-benzoquinol methylase